MSDLKLPNTAINIANKALDETTEDFLTAPEVIVMAKALIDVASVVSDMVDSKQFSDNDLNPIFHALYARVEGE